MALQAGFSREHGTVAAVLGLLCIVPFVVHSPYVLHLFILSMLYTMLAGSWNLINGYAGLFTFGHQAFFGIGAYGSALLAMNAGLSPWVTLVWRSSGRARRPRHWASGAAHPFDCPRGDRHLDIRGHRPDRSI